jgi:para-nitrobenzyl esterase
MHFPKPLLILAVLLLPRLAFTAPPPGTAAGPVKTTAGLVAGTTNAGGDVRVFKGIPFAAPPVGALRWKAPQPAKPWTSVRDCTVFGPSPVQNDPAPSACGRPSS